MVIGDEIITQFKLDVREAEELRLASHAALARDYYSDYCTFIDPSYGLFPHNSYLISNLEALERGDIYRLGITFPPQHGKSETASGKFPGWCIGRDPKRKVMIVCHSDDLAETFSGQNRDTIVENPRWPLVFPGVTMNPRKRGLAKWAVNDMRESVIASGIQGGITGYGAWMIVIDDPIKTEEQAASETWRNKVWMEYIKSVRTRGTADLRIILIMTRWNEDDLMGRIMASEEADQWTWLHLPALSYGLPEDYRKEGQTEMEYHRAIEIIPKTAFPDPLGRHKDAPLWVERYPRTFYLNQKLLMRHEFETMYQGNPSAPEGEKFKRDWFRGITSPVLAALAPEVMKRIGGYDLAWSEKQRADWAVRMKVSLYKPHKPEDVTDEMVLAYLNTVKIPTLLLVIEDVKRWKKDWPDTGEELIKTAVGDSVTYELLIETVAIQNVAFRNIKNDMRLWRHIFHAHKPEGDLDVRSKNALALGARGAIFLLYSNLTTPPEWEKDFLDELGKWPHATHDDQVSTLAQVVNYLQPTIDRLLNENMVQEMVTPFTHKPATSGKIAVPWMFKQAKSKLQRRFDGRSWFSGR